MTQIDDLSGFSPLARLGICGSKPELRRVPQRLAALRTPEGLPMSSNTLDETRRDLPLFWSRSTTSSEPGWNAWSRRLVRV